MSKMEFNMFIYVALNFYKYISKYLFHKMPTTVGKILGAFTIKI